MYSANTRKPQGELVLAVSEEAAKQLLNRLTQHSLKKSVALGLGSE